jgi:hypothetical protein
MRLIQRAAIASKEKITFCVTLEATKFDERQTRYLIELLNVKEVKTLVLWDTVRVTLPEIRTGWKKYRPFETGNLHTLEIHWSHQRGDDDFIMLVKMVLSTSTTLQHFTMNGWEDKDINNAIHEMYTWGGGRTTNAWEVKQVGWTNYIHPEPSIMEKAHLTTIAEGLKNIRYLHIAGVNINDEGANILANAFGEHAKFETVKIRCSNMTFSGANSIVDALKKVPSIYTLDLYGAMPPKTGEEVRRLVESLRTHPRIGRFRMSNLFAACGCQEGSELECRNCVEKISRVKFSFYRNFVEAVRDNTNIMELDVLGKHTAEDEETMKCNIQIGMYTLLNRHGRQLMAKIGKNEDKLLTHALEKVRRFRRWEENTGQERGQEVRDWNHETYYLLNWKQGKKPFKPGADCENEIGYGEWGRNIRDYQHGGDDMNESRDFVGTHTYILIRDRPDIILKDLSRRQN